MLLRVKLVTSDRRVDRDIMELIEWSDEAVLLVRKGGALSVCSPLDDGPTTRLICDAADAMLDDMSADIDPDDALELAQAIIEGCKATVH